MTDLLKGNFVANKTVEVEAKKETNEDRFEQAAMARLGGSIGYVSRKKFLWNGENGQDKEMKSDGRASQYDKD